MNNESKDDVIKRLNEKYPKSNIDIESVDVANGKIKFKGIDKEHAYALHGSRIFIEDEFNLFIRRIK